MIAARPREESITEIGHSYNVGLATISRIRP
jgi:hypothetical protein